MFSEFYNGQFARPADTVVLWSDNQRWPVSAAALTFADSGYIQRDGTYEWSNTTDLVIDFPWPDASICILTIEADFTYDTKQDQAWKGRSQLKKVAGNLGVSVVDAMARSGIYDVSDAATSAIVTASSGNLRFALHTAAATMRVVWKLHGRILRCF